MKHLHDNSGLCQDVDGRTNSDKGRDCENWIGIKYRRQAKNNARKYIQRILNENES